MNPVDRYNSGVYRNFRVRDQAGDLGELTLTEHHNELIVNRGTFWMGEKQLEMMLAIVQGKVIVGEHQIMLDKDYTNRYNTAKRGT